jgi:hypothetical protein
MVSERSREVVMSKQPLYPHQPKKRQPLFPHVPGSRQAERLPATEEEPRHFWVEKNVPYETWAIVEAFPGGTVRSPFDTKEEAIERENDIAEYREWKIKLVPSPQEKFPKQYAALKNLYPYEFVQYHDDGDLTIQQLVPKPGAKPPVPFHELIKGTKYVLTTDGEIFISHTGEEALKKIMGEEEFLSQTIELLAKTEGDPISKFCCSQCGECAPEELLEEGRFPDRISWLRRHYAEKHPGMWGKMTPMTVVDFEQLSPEYRHLASLIREPLPEEAD